MRCKDMIKKMRRKRIDFKTKIVSLSDKDRCTNLGDWRDMWSNSNIY